MITFALWKNLRNCLSFQTMPFGSPFSKEVNVAAKEFVAFLNKAVTPFHATSECVQQLQAAGFEELKEDECWKIEPLKKYYITKNRSAVCAFAIGGQYKPGHGFSIAAAHTDSPSLRVKPVSKQTRGSFLQVGVSTYGGGIWRTWFDRDLSLAGRIVCRDGDFMIQKLVNISKPVLFIPNLAVHFGAKIVEDNKETEVRPILATLAAEKLASRSESSSSKDDTQSSDPTSVLNDHHPLLLQMVAESAGCAPEAIVDFDLCIYDHQPASIGGINEEFITSQRLDNLVGTYTIIRGLIKSVSSPDSLKNDENIRMAVCFDNEECGSQSAQGADCNFIQWVLRRLTKGGSEFSFEQSVGRSFLISADQAHAVSPNYMDKYEENHRPNFHGGVVAKINCNQRYATNAYTNAIFKQIAKMAGVPVQKFVVRNDGHCGSTVGPMVSSHLAIQTVDVGFPMLAMHSIREMMCTSSVHQGIELYSTYFQNLPAVLKMMK
ncbi:hypothetical protein AB6A40_003782 [Gnathostoma spinigerum]|uniref:Aspartyl aminopeptidase n=1 Tax=Gnathostoma spinigerum TaxID=75299 RepID=A0ABD6EAQ6_9BILA